MREKSFAKINLYLEIVGIKDSGYHLINSLMVLIDIYDVITIEKNDKLDLIISGQDSTFLNQNKKDNIVIKATELMAQRFNFSPQIRITLEKNIPAGAGLGGGSSNCATTLLMLNKIYQLNLSLKQLMEIGFKLGCDVPFFLNQKAAFVSGLGEKISDLLVPQEQLLLLIINPVKNLATKSVYDRYRNNHKSNLSNYRKIIQTVIKNNSQPLISLISGRKNDLQQPAIEIISEIELVLKELEKQSGCLIARMSGSGPTCFGIFKNNSQLELAEKNLRQLFANFYIRKSKIIYNL